MENERSCVVNVDGKKYRRNKIHIRKTKEELNPRKVKTEDFEDEKVCIQGDIPSSIEYGDNIMQNKSSLEQNDDNQNTLPETTNERSKRTRKPNPKYKDFIMDR